MPVRFASRREHVAVADDNYGPFEPPVTITDAEWRILEVIRGGRTMTQASTDLGLPPHRLRFLVANLGQKLVIASKL